MTLVKVPSLDIKSANISQAPPWVPRPKYLLILDAVSGSGMYYSLLSCLRLAVTHLRKWASLAVDWLYRTSVKYSATYEGIMLALDQSFLKQITDPVSKCVCCSLPVCNRFIKLSMIQ